MKLWMVYNLHDYNINSTYYDMHVSKGKKYNMDIQLIIVEYLSFGVKNNKLYIEYDNNPISLPDGVIMRSRYSLLSKQLEMMGIQVFNNSYVCDICNDKAKTYQLLASRGIDIVDSEFLLGDKLEYMVRSSINSDNNDNLCNMNSKVIKTTNGHGGKEVYMAKDYLSNSLYKEDDFCSKDMVLQPLIKGDNKDLRVYILDNKIIGSVLRTGKESFKSNYSLGGYVELYTLNRKEEEIVNNIIELFNVETPNYPVKGIFYGGIDFIIDTDGKLLFNEIEDVVGSRMLYNTSDIDIVEEYLKCILKRY